MLEDTICVITSAVVPVFVTEAVADVLFPAATLPKFRLAGANCNDNFCLAAGAGAGWPLIPLTQPAVKPVTETASSIASRAPNRGATLLKVPPFWFLLSVDSMRIALPPLHLQGR